MRTITYYDRDGGAPKVTWLGRDFVSGRAVEIDDDRDAELIAAAKSNPWFTVSEDEAKAAAGAPGSGTTPYDRGFRAGVDGKDRSVPPNYRGKPEGDSWLAGYDDGAKSVGKAPPNTLATAGGPVSPSEAANALTPPAGG